MKKFRKFQVGNSLWLVPEADATEAFSIAVGKFNSASNDGGQVEWTIQESDAFLRVYCHANTFRPL